MVQVLTLQVFSAAAAGCTLQRRGWGGPNPSPPPTRPAHPHPPARCVHLLLQVLQRRLPALALLQEVGQQGAAVELDGGGVEGVLRAVEGRRAADG